MKKRLACACLAAALAGCSKPQTQTAVAPQPTAPQVTATPAQPPVAPPPQPATAPAPPETVTADPRKPETIPSGYTSQEEDEYAKRCVQIISRMSAFPNTSNHRNDFAECEAIVRQMQNEFLALGRPPYRLHKYASLFSESLSTLQRGFSLAKTAADLSNKQLLDSAKREVDNGFDLARRANAELKNVEKGTH